MYQVIKIILETQPADLAGLHLLTALRQAQDDDELSVPDLIALAPEIQEAVKELDRVATETRRLVEQCKTLKPIASQLIPPGF